MNFWRFLVLLAKKYISPIGTLTYTANLAISKTPFEVPKDDIFLSSSFFQISSSYNIMENNEDWRSERSSLKVFSDNKWCSGEKKMRMKVVGLSGRGLCETLFNWIGFKISIGLLKKPTTDSPLAIDNRFAVSRSNLAEY